ncbi:MAG: hypothetical protein WA932_10115 [Nitrososphaeraceae archaeon]
MTMNTIRVPLSWCVTNGSQAAVSPNIPDPWGGVDTTTDDVIWRRHERATDNIYLFQGTGITFRSGINDALHSSLNFPIIGDPRAIGTLGNVTFEESGTSSREYREMINDCFDKWQELIATGTVGGTPGVVNGIIVINVRQFVHLNGSVDTDLIGKAMCEKSSMGSACRTPWNGYVFVEDNCYTAVGATCGGIGWNNDPYDQNLAHEIGHALGLVDLYGTADSNKLMFYTQQEDPVTGRVTNSLIDATERTALRNNALLTPNSEVDPLDNITKGRIVQTVKVDEIQENESLLPFEDLALVKLTYDKNKNIIYIDQELSGLIPEKVLSNNSNSLQYWTLIDMDNNLKTGASQNTLHNIGVPSTKFLGADLLFLSSLNTTNKVNTTNITGTGWLFSNNTTSLLAEDTTNAEINTFFMESHYRDITKNTNSEDIPVFNTVRTIFNNSNLIRLNQPLAIQTIVSDNGTILDTLFDEGIANRTMLEFKQPFFPHCFAEDHANRGANTTVSIAGLRPNSEIYLSLGPRLITKGETDSSGSSNVTFTVPKDTFSGIRLITVGVDKSALTADCEMEIR